MGISLTSPLKKLMKKSVWFGNIIYATSLSALEFNWNECKKMSVEFENISFHEEYYELTKKRLRKQLSSKSRKSNSVSIKCLTKVSKIFQNKLSKSPRINSKFKFTNKTKTKSKLAIE